MATKRTKDELRAELELFIAIDEALHAAMPPGGNANMEKAQMLIGNLIRTTKKELGE